MASDQPTGPRNRQGSKRSARLEADAVEADIAAHLANLDFNLRDGEKVVIDAPSTAYYVQFAAVENHVTGGAVGVGHLPKLHAHIAGERIQAELRALGWSPPSIGGSGNWSRVWLEEDFDPRVVASLITSTRRGVRPRPEISRRKPGSPSLSFRISVERLLPWDPAHRVEILRSLATALAAGQGQHDAESSDRRIEVELGAPNDLLMSFAHG
jgi:hypothetical protein